MTLPDRLTVNLRTEDVEIDREELDELIERSDVSSISELVRELIRDELDEDDGS